MVSDESLARSRDTGLAILLILLLVVYFADLYVLILPCIVVLVAVMTWPKVFSPLAPIWFGFSHILGGVVSKILLTLIFMVIVTPIGLLRRMLGADSMLCSEWKSGPESVFRKRNQTYSAADIVKPF